MTIAGICELVLETDDVDRLQAFYEEELGLKQLLSEGEERIWLQVGDRCRLGIWSPGEKEYADRGGRHVHFAFSVGAEGLDALRIWDFFRDGDGAEEGVMALAEGDDGA
jgi:catechol-2,3-dioxygenase